MRAAVEEARAVGKYVLAHAYSSAAVRAAVAAGVRCIEHGNLLDAAGARAIREAGAYLVPTMVTYEVIRVGTLEVAAPPGAARGQVTHYGERYFLGRRAGTPVSMPCALRSSSMSGQCTPWPSPMIS
jgi:imidazolonepropionase-like amidohydrolase